MKCVAEENKRCPRAIKSTGILAPNFTNTSIAMQRAQLLKNGKGTATHLPAIVGVIEESSILLNLPVGIFGPGIPTPSPRPVPIVVPKVCPKVC